MLVVDDEHQVRATVREALEYEGYDVSEAGTGADALAQLRLHDVDVVVFDLWMPVMDGWELRRRLLAEYPGLPVIVLSALDLPADKLAELRADALVNKPFDLEVLYGALAELVARRRG